MVILDREWGAGRPIVGAVPGQTEVVATADAYTYGATSQALAEGQAMAAWADLSAKQNSPDFTANQQSPGCPEGWLLTRRTDRWPFQTCVNRDNVHILTICNDLGPNVLGDEDRWAACSEIVRYLQLNERKALNALVGSGQHTNTKLAKMNDLVLKGLRAMKMTTAEYGWQNVLGQLRAAAWQYIGLSFDDLDSGNVDEIRDAMVTAIGPYYDKDVADPSGAAARRNAIVRSNLKRAYVDMSSSSVFPVVLAAGAGAGLVYAFKPALAHTALSSGKRLLSTIIAKGKAIL